MKKLLLVTVALLATLTTFAQTNLTSGKTVYPLGGLKSFLPDDVVTEDNLQKITQDGNTDNVFLFPENGANLAYNQTLGIQGFYIDLGESKTIGAIQSTWEGADCGANIYLTNTEPAADGSLTGETLIATFDNAKESAKNVAVTAENSGRYIVFVPTVATNDAWGVKIRTFAAFEKEVSVLTSFEVSPSTVKLNEETALTLSPKDQLGLTLTDGVTYGVSSGTLNGNLFTPAAVGDVTITATYNGVSIPATIKVINISAPTENPTEPTDLAASVIAVYSAKYGKGINDSNPGWGIGGGAPDPFYTSVEEVEIANAHKVVHVKGTGFNSRTAGGAEITSDYSKVYVALYPFSATQAKIFGDNQYGNAKTVDGLVPGQWNYISVDNTGSFPNYMLVELVGETEFYLDHFYAAKPAVEDDEAPVLETAELAAAGIGSLTLKLKATDNKSAQVTYVITDQNNAVYTTKGNSGAEITFAIGNLAFDTEYTLSIIAKDDNENASAAQTVTGTTTALTAAPVPTKDAADVISLYSNAYEAATTWYAGGWGQSTVMNTVAVDGDDILKFSNFNYFGFDGFSNQLDLSDMVYLHIDVLPMQDMNLRITPIMTSAPIENATTVGTLTAGVWNSKDIKLSDLGLDYANAKAFQLKIDNGNGSDILFVDNIYFWKDGGDTPDPQPTELIDNGADANGMHKLTGPWSDEAFAAIDAVAKANSYDLTDVSHNGTINVVDKTANPFCMFVTSTPGTVNRNELVAEGEGYHGYAIFLQENWNDSKTYDINTSLSPITVGNPFFQRLFDRAGYYVTITVPFDYDRIPDAANGTKFYEIAASTDNKSITFREVTAIEKNKPYLVYVATGGITIPDPGTVTIDFAAATEQSGSMSFMANYKQQTLSTGYVLPLGALAADGLTFLKADGATLRPFRAYIASASAEARISVLFDEATGLRSATAEELGKLFNVYSIDGRVVRQQTNSAANLPAGIYVINGKKAVVK
ncbi:MAG: hypothetical protein J5942_08875 [Prevotella sp.]|nr:hypothetical protein [Prevotella sp.]